MPAMNMSMQVSFITYFGDYIQSKLPDEVFGLIISFMDMNAYTIVCKLNTYLRTISQDDWRHLLWVNNVADNNERYHKTQTICINRHIIHCFINIMNCMPLLFKSGKNRLVGKNCKHYIEHQFVYGVAYWGNNNKKYVYLDKRLLNGEQCYTTSGKLRLPGFEGYVDRLSTTIAFILSGFKRDGIAFYITEVRHTRRVVFENRHLTINNTIV